MGDFTASNYGIDGYIPPELALPSQPVDAAGGSAGDYAQPVLDLFKFGIGVWQSAQAQSNALDYKKYEASNGQLSQNGVASNRVVAGSAPASGMNTTTVMMIVGGLLVALLLLKKAR